MAYCFNLGLPCWAADLTTIDHIDEFSFHDHPASDPHATEEEILERDNELPSYQPKTEPDMLLNSGQDIVLGEALPPKYQEVVVDINESEDSSVHSASSSSSSSSAGSSSHQRS